MSIASLVSALALTAVASASLSHAPRPTAGTTATPTLGRRLAPSQEGYGTVRPSTIFNGGDPTGLVQHVRWTHWGQSQAIGYGTGDFVWPGQSVAQGSTPAPATLVAFDPGPCHGRLAYRKLAWYFPGYGQSFEPSQAADICSESTSFPPYVPPAQCGQAAIRSPAGLATEIQAEHITCAEALQLVAASPSVQYLHSGGRFVYAGLYCGSEGLGVGGSSPSFQCAKGRVDILFDVSA